MSPVVGIKGSLVRGKESRPTAIDRRNNTDYDWPHHDQEIRRKRVDSIWETSNLLEDVEPVTLDDICCAGFSLGVLVHNLKTYRVPSRLSGTTRR